MYLGWRAKQRPDAIAVIESGGVDIYPQAAENVLVMHPGVADFVLSLPRDPSGKLRKGLLREAYRRNHETRIV